MSDKLRKTCLAISNSASQITSRDPGGYYKILTSNMMANVFTVLQKIPKGENLEFRVLSDKFFKLSNPAGSDIRAFLRLRASRLCTWTELKLWTALDDYSKKASSKDLKKIQHMFKKLYIEKVDAPNTETHLAAHFDILSVAAQGQLLETAKEARANLREIKQKSELEFKPLSVRRKALRGIIENRGGSQKLSIEEATRYQSLLQEIHNFIHKVYEKLEAWSDQYASS